MTPAQAFEAALWEAYRPGAAGGGEGMNLAECIYTKMLPRYFPNYNTKYALAIWCCIDNKLKTNLVEVLKGTRITIRKGGSPIFVIKKGHV